MTQNSHPSHIVWVDVLRFVAIFMVIACHCTDPFNISPAAKGNPDFNLWGSLFGAFLRPCVPLFVMITGLLLLPVRQECGTFYKKRIPRVLVPFLIWSVIYNLFPWFSQALGGTPALVNRFFAYADSPSPLFSSALKDIALIPVNFSIYTTHLWYVYLIIGLYLYLPVFSAWVEKVSRKAQLTFLLIWGVTLFMPYLQRFVTPYLWGECAWNNFGMLYYFAGFNGYLLLGYYLANSRPLSLVKTYSIAVPLFLAGYAVTYFGFRKMTGDPSVTETDMELFFTYCSINVVCMTIAVFLLVKKVRVPSLFLQKQLANLTKCGFGIYLIHYFFVGPCYTLTETFQIPLGLRIPVSAVFVFVLAWTSVALLYRLPKAKWLVG